MGQTKTPGKYPRKMERKYVCGSPTVDNHLKAMDPAHLLMLLPNVGAGGKKLLRTRPKAYVDPTLRNAALMRGEELFTDAAALGHLVETAVVTQTLAFLKERDLRPWAGYWRDPATGREVDLVATLPRAGLLLEVRYRPDASAGPGDGLLTYDPGGAPVRRRLITRRAEDAGIDPRTGVLRLPAFAYLYVLGGLA